MKYQFLTSTDYESMSTDDIKKRLQSDFKEAVIKRLTPALISYIADSYIMLDDSEKSRKKLFNRYNKIVSHLNSR
jgi:hypothetical protein